MVIVFQTAIANIKSVKELHLIFHGEYMVKWHNGKRMALTRGVIGNNSGSWA